MKLQKECLNNFQLIMIRIIYILYKEPTDMRVWLI